MLISSKGRILEEITENTDKLPLLTCGEVKTTEVGKYVAFNDANVPDILSDVSQCLIDNKIKISLPLMFRIRQISSLFMTEKSQSISDFPMILTTKSEQQ